MAYINAHLFESQSQLQPSLVQLLAHPFVIARRDRRVIAVRRDEAMPGVRDSGVRDRAERGTIHHIIVPHIPHALHDRSGF